MKNSIFNKGISTPKGILIIVLAAIIAGAGILAYQYYWLGGEEVEAPEKLNLEILKNAEYCCIYSLEPDELIQLKNGDYSKISYEGLIMHHIEFGIHNNKVAFGDLNGNGKEDAAVILSSNFGGSGCFRELAIMINQDGEPYYLTSERLGDRKIINSITIQSGIITIDMITHGLNDPACCPTLKKIIRYKLSEDKIKEIVETETADWKIYKNKEYGFEIKYPKDYGINIEVFDITKPRNYNLADNFVNHSEDWASASDNEQLPPKFYEVIINDRTWKGYYYVGGIGAAEPITYFTRDNNLVIGVVMADIYDFINSFEEIKNMLSTFRFLD